MIGFIYKYENKINHKVYIGQTTDLVNRKAAHKNKAIYERNKFYNAVRKYGWDNFDYDIIAQVEEDSLDALTKILDTLEIKFIAEYDSFNNGYNSTTGGHCYRGKEVSDEFREYCRNRQYSEETRKKMSDSAKKRVVSEETRQKCRENALRRNFGRVYREAATEKRNSAIRKAKAKAVIQIDKDGTIVNEFPTLREAIVYTKEHLAPNISEYGIEHGIHRHCSGYTKTRYYYGFEWKFRANV